VDYSNKLGHFQTILPQQRRNPTTKERPTPFEVGQLIYCPRQASAAKSSSPIILQSVFGLFDVGEDRLQSGDLAVIVESTAILAVEPVQVSGEGRATASWTNNVVARINQVA
jgi:uncharacterized membrane protein (UPF0182 family)